MSAQKYNVLSMYKKKFMQFKTNAPSFSFFLAGVGQGVVKPCPAGRACVSPPVRRPPGSGPCPVRMICGAWCKSR